MLIRADASLIIKRQMFAVSVVLRSIGSQIRVFIKAIWNLHLWLRCIILNIFMRAIWTRQVLGRTCYVVLEHSMPSILCSRVQDSAEYRLKLVLITMAEWIAFHLLSRDGTRELLCDKYRITELEYFKMIELSCCFVMQCVSTFSHCFTLVVAMKPFTSGMDFDNSRVFTWSYEFVMF